MPDPKDSTPAGMTPQTRLDPNKPADDTPKINLGTGGQNTPANIEMVPSPMSEVGISGLATATGYVLEEKLKQLNAAGINNKANNMWREMSDNDPTVSAVMLVWEMMVRKVKWKIEPASQDDLDIEAAEFMESVIADMDTPWQDVITDIIQMFIFGWSSLEIVYKRRLGPDSKDPTMRSSYNDGLIGWRKLAGRAQESCAQWVFDKDGEVLGWWQWPPLSGNRVFLPREKIMLFRTTNKKNNPQGRSMLRGAYVPYFRKSNLERIEAIGIERDLAGLPLLYVDPDILAADASEDFKTVLEEYKKIMTRVRADEQACLILPSVFNEQGKRIVEFSLVGTGSRRQNNTDGIIKRYAQDIAMCMLCDFILIGHDSVGSFALTEQKYDMFVLCLGAFMDSIAEQFNKDGFRKLWELNAFPPERMPKIVPGQLEKQDIAEMALALQQLTAAGWIFPGGLDDENFVRKLLGMTERVEMPAQVGDAVTADNYMTHPEMQPDAQQQQMNPDPAPVTSSNPSPSGQAPAAQTQAALNKLAKRLNKLFKSKGLLRRKPNFEL